MNTQLTVKSNKYCDLPAHVAERRKEYYREYYRLHKERKNKQSEKWRKENPERSREIGRRGYFRNREKYLAYNKLPHVLKRNMEHQRKYRKRHPERSAESIAKSNAAKKENGYQRKWYQDNKERIRGRHHIRKATDIQYNLAKLCRSRLNNALKRRHTPKTQPTIDLLGCSWEFFMEYIESKFSDGMTWDNRGKMGWHIDHIRPVCSFDLTSHDDLHKCFHYTNLQPLWWHENLKKHAKILP